LNGLWTGDLNFVKLRPMKTVSYIVLAGGLILSACQTLKGPGNDPAEMSSLTLCHNYTNSRDEALGAEIQARNLDCADLLKDDPIYNPSQSASEAMHRGMRY